MSTAVLERLEALGLLRQRPKGIASRLKGARPENVLPLLCDAGALDGGLSIALDVRPDEALGALCTTIGGGAKKLRVDDVRDRPELELTVAVGELRERWATPDVRALAHNLNDLFREDVEARVLVDLGDWEDALQLWSVPRATLPSLFQERFFAPNNERQLRSLLGEAD